MKKIVIFFLCSFFILNFFGCSKKAVKNGKTTTQKIDERMNNPKLKVQTTLKVYVLPDGTVEKAEVIKSSGFPELDKGAVHSIKQKKYDPLPEGKAPAKVRIIDEVINFSSMGM